MRRHLLRGGRLVVDTALGWLLLAAGAVMLVTPGPGLVAIAAGLALLARHYRWAHRGKSAVMWRLEMAGAQVRGRLVRRRPLPPRTARVPEPGGGPADAGPSERDAA